MIGQDFTPKEIIIPILVGFTLVTSLYGTMKIRELERKIRYVERNLSREISDVKVSLSGRIMDNESRLGKIERRMK